MAAMPALGCSRARRPPDRACVMLLADGARADVFERLLEEGELPNIARHVVARGDYRRASTVFTSTTGPAHVPFLTGMFPGTADIPGIRWFDRRKYRPDLGGGALRMRSYVGAEAGLVNADLNPDAHTLFELCENPLNIFGFVTRGLPKRADIEGGRKLWLWPHAHSSGDYTQADGWAARAAERVIHRTSEFVFVMFPGIDGHAHHFAPDDERTLNSYRTVDRAVRKIANVLSHEGTYDNTLIVICSDHGHSEVLEHFDVAVALEREHGLRVAYHMGRTLTMRPEAVVCVSGNGMAHLYFAAGDWSRPPALEQIEAAHPGLLARLREEPAVDIVATRVGPGELIVESRRGRARLADAGDGALPGGGGRPVRLCRAAASDGRRRGARAHLRQRPPRRARPARPTRALGPLGGRLPLLGPRLRPARALRGPGAPLGPRSPPRCPHARTARDERALRRRGPGADRGRLSDRAALPRPRRA